MSWQSSVTLVYKFSFLAHSFCYNTHKSVFTGKKNLRK